jgi:hypothetical protein
MKINKDNVMVVAFWLLQCDPSGFEGPLVPVASWFEALGDVYSPMKVTPLLLML